MYVVVHLIAVFRLLTFKFSTCLLQGKSMQCPCSSGMSCLFVSHQTAEFVGNFIQSKSLSFLSMLGEKPDITCTSCSTDYAEDSNII